MLGDVILPDICDMFCDLMLCVVPERPQPWKGFYGRPNFQWQDSRSEERRVGKECLE